jgi:integrase
MCAVRLEDIDVGKRTLRVDDPSGYRAPENKYTNKEQFGFKGRETAAVTMFEPFQSIFWEALASYLEVRPRSNSPWLLLSTRPDTYGVPLCDLKGNTVTKAVDRSIQATQRKLKLVAPQGNYAIHSFRHFYGIWGRNYVCVPGRPSPGLGLEEMQLLMGHANAKTTEHYAPDLGLNRLAEIDAANMMVFHKGQGEGIDYYRGQVYARVADSLLKGDHDK